MDDTQGNIVEETTTSAIPTEDKPAESEGATESDGRKERTPEQQAKIDAYNRAEYEKILASKKAVEEELAAYKNKNSVLDELKPSEIAPSLSPEKVDEIQGRFIDENGYVDVAKVEEALSKAEKIAREAVEKANRVSKQIQDSEEKAQVKVAHTEFPQLNPHNEKFDQKFYELVRNELIGQMMNGEQDIVKAAQKVSAIYSPVNVEQAKSEAVDAYKSKVTKRDQATEEVSGRGKGEPSDQDELIRKTREGDKIATFKRLQASGN